MSIVQLHLATQADGSPNWVTAGVNFFRTAVASTWASFELVAVTRPIYVVQVNLIGQNAYESLRTTTVIDTLSASHAPVNSIWAEDGKTSDAAPIIGRSSTDPSGTPTDYQQHNSGQFPFADNVPRYIAPGKRLLIQNSGAAATLQGSILWVELLDF